MWVYSGGNSDNHKKGYCLDGVKQKVATNEDKLLPWPQLNKIFMKRTHFWLTHFNRTIHELYDMVTDGNTTGGPRAMEYVAFVEMLQKRLIIIPTMETQPSCVCSKLYCAFQFSKQPGSPSNIVKVDGVKYFHITYLSKDAFQEVVAQA